MKKMNLFALMLIVALLLSIVAFSQLSPITSIITYKDQITPAISLEKKETCTTSFYDEVQDVYGTCINYYNYTDCINTTGPNTGCSLKQTTREFECKTGENTVPREKTECVPEDKFVISIGKGTAMLKKQLDFSDFGPCIYEEENNCLVVTCQSRYDGANDGKFHSCKPGTSCQKFEICDGSIKTFYKNSREGFVEDDPTFFLDKLALGEVEE